MTIAQEFAARTKQIVIDRGYVFWHSVHSIWFCTVFNNEELLVHIFKGEPEAVNLPVWVEVVNVGKDEETNIVILLDRSMSGASKAKFQRILKAPGYVPLCALEPTAIDVVQRLLADGIHETAKSRDDAESFEIDHYGRKLSVRVSKIITMSGNKETEFLVMDCPVDATGYIPRVCITMLVDD